VAADRSYYVTAATEHSAEEDGLRLARCANAANQPGDQLMLHGWPGTPQRRRLIPERLSSAMVGPCLWPDPERSASSRSSGRGRRPVVALAEMREESLSALLALSPGSPVAVLDALLKTHS
jgi:hypothetical protein